MIKDYIKKLNIEKTDVIIFLIVVLMFILVWIAFYPAIMTSDSVGQLQQAITNNYNNAHPVFHTFIIGILFKTKKNVSAISIFQILIFAVIWTSCCKITRAKDSQKKIKVFQVIMTLIICFNPVNFMFSVTIWKDVLYSYFVLCVVACIYCGLKNNFNYSYFQMLITAFSLVCVMKIRHNGMPIGIIVFLILFILNLYRNYKVKKNIKSIFFILSFIILLCSSYIPQLVLCKDGDELSVSSAFTTTKICCMGVLLNQNIELEYQEKEILDSILDINIWKEISDPYWGTAIIYNENYNAQYLNIHIHEFNEVFYKYAKQYPKEVIKYFVKSNSTAWSISLRSWTHTIFTNNDGIKEMSYGLYDTSPKSMNLNSIYLNYINYTMNNKFIYTILYRPAVFMYIAMILNTYIVIKKKNILYALLSFPMLLNVGTYMPFIISQEVRYLYPNFLTCYFLIIVLGDLIGKNDYHKETTKVKVQQVGNKVLIIIPAYNEEKSIKDVVNKIYENTTDCDVVVVNDGSKDNTYIEAKKTKAIVIDLPNNLGIGGAVQTGYLYAYKNNYDIAIQVDADGQHDSKYINEMVEVLKDGQADMVIGSRFIEKTSYKQTFFRMLGINITSGIIKVLTGKKIHDTTSGFRAINRDIIEDFANNYPYDYPEPCTNMEMILKGKKIVEIPVEMKQRETGVSSISPLKSVKYMLKVILSLFLMKIKKY